MWQGLQSLSHTVRVTAPFTQGSLLRGLGPAENKITDPALQREQAPSYKEKRIATAAKPPRNDGV